MASPIKRKTLAQRAVLCTNPAAKALLELMDRKKSNLSISRALLVREGVAADPFLLADVTAAKELLHIVDVCGPYICMLKARAHSPFVL